MLVPVVPGARTIRSAGGTSVADCVVVAGVVVGGGVLVAVGPAMVAVAGTGVGVTVAGTLVGVAVKVTAVAGTFVAVAVNVTAVALGVAVASTGVGVAAGWSTIVGTSSAVEVLAAGVGVSNAGKVAVGGISSSSTEQPVPLISSTASNRTRVRFINPLKRIRAAFRFRWCTNPDYLLPAASNFAPNHTVFLEYRRSGLK